jgi:hypothetical protein
MSTENNKPQGGGSYIARPDGSLLQVAGPGMTPEQIAAAEAEADTITKAAAKAAEDAAAKAKADKSAKKPAAESKE